MCAEPALGYNKSLNRTGNNSIKLSDYRTVEGKTCDFMLPATKNGLYESILFWLGVAVLMRIAEKSKVYGDSVDVG